MVVHPLLGKPPFTLLVQNGRRDTANTRKTRKGYGYDQQTLDVARKAVAAHFSFVKKIRGHFKFQLRNRPEDLAELVKIYKVSGQGTKDKPPGKGSWGSAG